MKALVTGGGGFLGLYIVEQLLAAGHQVRVFSRGAYSALNKLNVESMQGDLRDAAAAEAACRGMESVFHVAAVPGIWGPWKKFYGVNTLGTRNIIAGCRRHGVGRLIFTSSPSVVFDGTDQIDADETLPYPSRWLCHYPHSKALAEQEVLSANDPRQLRTISLRPHLIWGPRDNHLIPRLIARARSGKLKRVGDGTNVVSVAYVENVAAAHLQAERVLRDSDAASGRAYFINEPESVNLWGWIDRLLGIAGLEPVQSSLSFSSAFRIGAVCEFVYQALRLSVEPPMTRFVASQLGGSHSYSIAAAQRDLGYQQLFTIEQGLEKTAPDLRQHLPVDVQ